MIDTSYDTSWKGSPNGEDVQHWKAFQVVTIFINPSFHLIPMSSER